LYINYINAYIKIVIKIAVIIFLILIFPIFIGFNFHYLNNTRKVYFEIKLFNFVNVFNGSINFHLKNIVIKNNFNKDILISYRKLIGLKNKINPLKDFNIIKFNSIVEIGSKNPLLAIGLGNFINIIIQNLGFAIKSVKPYLYNENDILVYANEKKLKIYCNGYLVFNILTVILSLIKIGVEKVINGKRKRTVKN